VPLAEGQQFTSVGRQIVALSPDGRLLAFAANNRLYIRPLASADATVVPGTESFGGLTNLAFSPDSQSVVFFTAFDGTLKKISVSGGTAVTLCATTNPFGVGWSVDGILFGIQGKGILRVAENGGAPEVLIDVPRDELSSAPQLLPDRQTVLFTLVNASAGISADDAQIVIQRVHSQNRQTLIHGGGDGRYLPSGHVVYAVGGTEFAVPFDVRGLRVTGSPVPVIEGVRRATNVGAAAAPAQLTTSLTGSLAYVPGPAMRSDTQRDLVVFNRKGGVQRLNLGKDSYQYPRVSPNGQEMTYGTEDRDQTIVWVYNLSGASAPRRLTFMGKNQFPIWSADGQWITFQAADGGLFKQRANGSGVAERLTTADRGTTQIPESWSPDGKILSLTVATPTTTTLAFYSVETRKLTPVPGFESTAAFNSDISPDGKWIAYSWRAGGGTAVQVQPMPPTGARYQVSKGDVGHHPLWSRDGKELFYFPSGGPLTAVEVTTAPVFTTTDPVVVAPTFLANTTPFRPRNHDITPDGRFVAAVSAEAQAGPAPQIRVVLNWFTELQQRVPTR
jgi:serine/threonine-protein kinase